MNSNAEGVIPALNTADTASQAFSEEWKGTTILTSFVGNGMSRKTILVIIPNVPSEPIRSCFRSYPVLFFLIIPQNIVYLHKKL